MTKPFSNLRVLRVLRGEKSRAPIQDRRFPIFEGVFDELSLAFENEIAEERKISRSARNEILEHDCHLERT